MAYFDDDQRWSMPEFYSLWWDRSRGDAENAERTEKYLS
jgi:hypothetical protein